MKIRHVKNANAAFDLSRREFPCSTVIKANDSHLQSRKGAGSALTHADPALIFSILSLGAPLIFYLNKS